MYTSLLPSYSCVSCFHTVSLVVISMVTYFTTIRMLCSINEVSVNICTTHNYVLLFDYGRTETQLCTKRMKAIMISLNHLASTALTHIC